MITFLACIGAFALFVLVLLALLCVAAILTIKSAARRVGDAVPSLIQEAQPTIGTYKGKWRVNDESAITFSADALTITSAQQPTKDIGSAIGHFGGDLMGSLFKKDGAA